MKEEISAYVLKEMGSLQRVQLLVKKNGETLCNEVYEAGNTQENSTSNEEIDIGNLKEVIAILPVILKLVEQRRKKLALNHLVSNYIPTLEKTDKESLQVMNLLTHTSGLPNDAKISFRQLVDTPLDFKPGSKVAYSELNFKLLPTIFEMASGHDFELFLQTFLFDPLLMEQTKLLNQVDGDLQVMSSLNDLSHFGEMFINGGKYDFMKVIHYKAIQLSIQNFTSFLNEHRGLGWQLVNDTYGFIGNKGISMWLYPKQKLSVVLAVEAANQSQVAEFSKELFQFINTLR